MDNISKNPNLLGIVFLPSGGSERKDFKSLAVRPICSEASLRETEFG